KDKTERLKLDLDKVKAWLAKGALPTDRVLRFLDQAGVMKREKRNNPTRAIPRKQRKAQAEEAAKAAAAAKSAGAAAGAPARCARELTRACAGSPDVAERICVAQIGGAHGLRGDVKLKSFTADPMAVSNYGPLTTEDGSASFEIEALRAAKGHLVARFRGVSDRSAAERLAHLRLFVPRDRLPPPSADE